MKNRKNRNYELIEKFFILSLNKWKMFEFYKF